METPTNHEQVVLWAAQSGAHANAVAWAESVVIDLHPGVVRGSEQFYGLVVDVLLDK